MSGGQRNNGFVERLHIPATGSGPLDGLTFGLKDIYDIAGRVAGCGNPDWARTHAAAGQHSHVAEKLLAAGAALAGMTHTDELAYSLNGENVHYGTPVNQNAPTRIPGGSSSGSASVTAAGLVDFAIGSDTGGSVRIPGSYCGIFGIRTTHGVIDLDGCMPLAPSYDTVGWFARDAEILTRVGNALLPPESPENPAIPTDGWRMLSDSALFELCDPETAQFLNAEYAQLISNSAQTDLYFDAEESKEAFRILQAREIWETHGDWIKACNPAFAADVDGRFRMAAAISDEEVEQMRPIRHRLVEQLHGLLGDNGCLILPTAPGPAPLAGSDPASLDTFRYRVIALTSLAGHAGLPQVTIPCQKDGQPPIALSLIGPAASDRSLLALTQHLTDPSKPFQVKA